jgi:tetratricopeptide (TPR) repeat protein
LLPFLGACDKVEKAVTRLTSGEDTLSTLMERKSGSVYQLTTYDATGEETGKGTAFAISAEGRLLTSYKLLRGIRGLTATSSTGTVHSVASVPFYDEAADLAVLQLEAGALTPNYAELVSSSLAEIGTPVAVIGGPLGLSSSLSEGILSGRRQVQEGKVNIQYIQVTAPISPGSGGSPVFMLDGRVIGVVSINLREGQLLNFAVTTEHVRSFLNTPEARQKPIPLRLWRDLPKDPFLQDPAGKLAIRAYREGDTARALERLGALQKTYPQSASLHAYAGECLRRDGRHREALKFHQQAIKLEKGVGWFWAGFAQSLEKEQYRAEALKAYREALRLDASDAESGARLAFLLVEDGNHQDAVKYYRQALEYRSDEARWWKELARVHLKLEQLEEALACWDKALKQGADTPTLLAARDACRRLGKDTTPYDVKLVERGVKLGTLPPNQARTKWDERPTYGKEAGWASGVIGVWQGEGVRLNVLANRTVTGTIKGQAFSASWEATANGVLALTITHRRGDGELVLSKNGRTLSAGLPDPKGGMFSIKQYTLGR